MLMRLDKFLTATGTATRTEAAKAVRSGNVAVDGITARSADMKLDPELSKVIYCGEEIEYRKYTYIMLNKPDGYVSATDDPRERTVLELLPEKYSKMGLFPCGRLDKNTLGLVILTNNGQLAHKLLSPKKHCEKIYRFISKYEVSAIEALECGVELEDGYVTKPSKIELIKENEGYITLVEGKYHQIKRMFEAIGNKITYLERVEFAGIKLDSKLERGEWRFLTSDEQIRLEEYK